MRATLVWLGTLAGCGPAPAVITPLDGSPLDPEDCQAQVAYPDEDGDGYGNSALARPGCPQPGEVAEGGDCDDQDVSTFPGAPEQCNGRDDDCDPSTDELGTVSVDGLGVSDWKESLRQAGGSVVVGLCGGTHDWVDVSVSDEVSELVIEGVHPQASAELRGEVGRSLTRAFDGDLQVQDLILREGRLVAGPSGSVSLEGITLGGTVIVDPTGALQVELVDLTAQAESRLQISVQDAVSASRVRFAEGGALVASARQRIDVQALTFLGSSGAAEDRLTLLTGDASTQGTLDVRDLQTRDTVVELQGDGNVRQSTLVDSDVSLVVSSRLDATDSTFRGERGSELRIRTPVRGASTAVRLVGLDVLGAHDVHLDSGDSRFELQSPTLARVSGQIVVSGDVRMLGGQITQGDSRGQGALVRVSSGGSMLVSAAEITSNRSDRDRGAIHLQSDTLLQLDRVDLGSGSERNTPADVSTSSDVYDGEGITSLICTGEDGCG